MNAIIGLIFLGILISLGSGLFYMLSPNGRPSDASMVKALTTRISLSIALFACLLLLGYAGVIEPQGF
jgi:hypothetical protein